MAKFEKCRRLRLFRISGFFRHSDFRENRTFATASSYSFIPVITAAPLYKPSHLPALPEGNYKQPRSDCSASGLLRLLDEPSCWLPLECQRPELSRRRRFRFPHRRTKVLENIDEYSFARNPLCVPGDPSPRDNFVPVLEQRFRAFPIACSNPNEDIPPAPILISMRAPHNALQ